LFESAGLSGQFGIKNAHSRKVSKFCVYCGGNVFAEKVLELEEDKGEQAAYLHSKPMAVMPAVSKWD